MRRVLGFGCLGLVALILVVVVISLVGGGGNNTATTNTGAGPEPQTAEEQAAAQNEAEDAAAANEAATSQAAADAAEQQAEEKADQAEEDTEAAEQEARTIKLKQAGPVGDYVWTISKAGKRNQLRSEFLDPLKPQGVFVVVEGSVENTGNDAQTVDSSILKLVDSEGRAFDPSNETFGYIPENKNLFLTQVNPGLTRQFQVVFDVPKDAGGLRLRASDGAMFGEEAILVDLGL